MQKCEYSRTCAFASLFIVFVTQEPGTSIEGDKKALIVRDPARMFVSRCHMTSVPIG